MPASMAFADRREAGRRLAERLSGRVWTRPLVLALPRGGLPVGAEVARALGGELDVLVVRKLGMPGSPETALGALAEDGTLWLNPKLRGLVEDDYLERETRRKRAELDRRAALFRREFPAIPAAGRDVIVVDDGVATGATAEAALRLLGRRGAARVTLAVPVAPPSAAGELAALADECLVLEQPPDFRAVGEWYEDFSEVSDAQALAILRNARL